MPIKITGDKCMISYEYAVQCLRTAVGRDDISFRDGQWEAISAILNRKRVLVVQRTGWGKSMIYFLSSKFLREEGRGMTLLISPLIALMRNQLAAAKKVGIRCMTINSTNTADWDECFGKVRADEVDLLLVAPERLANEDFNKNVLDVISDNVGLLVIDEAHCVSDWGHDFRTDYRRISRLISGLPPNIPVLATTATANNRVIEDIREQLGGNFETLRGDLVRKSLFLQNIKLDKSQERYAWIGYFLKNIVKGSGIIYTMTIRDAKMLAQWLRSVGVSAYAYWGSSTPPEDIDPKIMNRLESIPGWKKFKKEEKENRYRVLLEDLLINNEIRALIATPALGMGFDKSDLSFVIHYQRPQSVIHYYQQVGRAGRGIDHAYGILLNGEEDDDIADFFIEKAFPSEEQVRELLDVVNDSEYGLSISDMQKSINLAGGRIEKTIKFLMSEPKPPIVKFENKYLTTKEYKGYKLPTDRIERLTRIRYEEKEKMNEYMGYESCLMGFLCKELESPMEGDSCGNCYRCCPEKALDASVDQMLEKDAVQYLNRTYLKIEPRKHLRK